MNNNIDLNKNSVVDQWEKLLELIQYHNYLYYSKNDPEISDEEYYECLRWANSTLMKNYYDKQKTSTLAQIDYLYTEKDTSFRGFRHNTGNGQTGAQLSEKAKAVKDKAIAIQGNETMDGLVNWEASQTSDAERFSQNNNLNYLLKTVRKTTSYNSHHFSFRRIPICLIKSGIPSLLTDDISK